MTVMPYNFELDDTLRPYETEDFKKTQGDPMSSRANGSTASTNTN